MKRTVAILLFLISFFICSGLSSNVIAQKTKTAASKSTEKPDSEMGVDQVRLDKETAITECPWKSIVSRSGVCSAKWSTIDVTSVSKTAEKNNLTYYYVVSGGEIVGQGAQVKWDLGRVRSGEYKMMVGVGANGIVRGKTVVKTIRVQLCDCHPPCSCPTISVSAPTKPTKPGDLMTFTTSVSGGTQDSVAYNWTVSDGKIVSGQGTWEILVDTTEIAGKSITATVEIGGLCSGACQRTASATANMDCTCPTMSVLGPAKPANPGDLMLFTVNLSSQPESYAKYKWTVSDGTIIQGQGTTQIAVQTTPEMAGKTITATLELEGVCPTCTKTASATGHVTKKRP